VFVAERHQKILHMLEEEGKVLVTALSDHFSVSRDLIRKDLALLESEGLLKRVYGGAIPIKSSSPAKKWKRASANPNPVWFRIAEKAADLIRNGETIFLDISPICLKIATRLKQENRRITVVTNSIDILSELNEDSRIKLIFLGGKLNPARDGFTGALTIEWMSRYEFDHAFIEGEGIDLKLQMVTSDDIDDALTKTSAIKSSRHSVLLVDAAQLKRHGNCRSAALEDFDCIIIDKSIEEAALKVISNKINQVILA
jgi:DeoR family glycerol-3-phosphate regulon repressor